MHKLTHLVRGVSGPPSHRKSSLRFLSRLNNDGKVTSWSTVIESPIETVDTSKACRFGSELRFEKCVLVVHQL